jgi:hypothetical protein
MHIKAEFDDKVRVDRHSNQSQNLPTFVFSSSFSFSFLMSSTKKVNITAAPATEANLRFHCTENTMCQQNDVNTASSCSSSSSIILILSGSKWAYLFTQMGSIEPTQLTGIVSPLSRHLCSQALVTE